MKKGLMTSLKPQFSDLTNLPFPVRQSVDI